MAKIGAKTIKHRLAANAGTLCALPQRVRPILAVGSESVVLIDSEDSVLLIMRKHVAINIELLHGLSLDAQPFVKPKIVAIDADLALLMIPHSKAQAKRVAKVQGAVFYPELWTKNVVYSLPRYDGTLEDLSRISFSEVNIIALEKMLTTALTFLHEHNLTHNDIALKNIFYKGKSPDLQFYLGDFGSLSKKSSKTHAMNCQRDFARVAHVIEKVKKILEHKNAIRKKYDQPSLFLLPSYTNKLRARLGISPLKLPTPATTDKVENIGKQSAAKKLRFR